MMAATKMQSLAKLSGSFALGGLISQSLAREDSFLSEVVQHLNPLQPRVAHTLALTLRSTQRAPRLVPFYGIDDFGRAVKVYPSEMRLLSLGSQFTSKALLGAYLRGLAVTLYPIMDEHLCAVQRAEDEARAAGREFDFFEDGPEIDWEAIRVPFITNVTLAAARDRATAVVRVLLSWLAVKKLDRRLSWKLVKDLPSALGAKAALPVLERPLRACRTYIRGMLISTVAEMLVSSCWRTFGTLQERLPERERRIILRRKLAVTPFRTIGGLAAASLGAAAMAVIWPGYACQFAAMGAGAAFDVFVCRPAEDKYLSTGKVGRDTVCLILGSGAIIALAFSDFSDLSVSSDPLESKALALR